MARDFEKFVVTNKQIKGDNSKYLNTLGQKTAVQREVDARSKDGLLGLRWNLFKTVKNIFFIGYDLLCLVNEPYIAVIENVSSTPAARYFNLLNNHSSQESSLAGKNGTTTIHAVAGCQTGLLLAYAMSDHHVIYIVSFPSMNRIAALKGRPNCGDYRDLYFGTDEFLYAIRGFPKNAVEIWNLRTLSIAGCIPGAFYSNNVIFRVSFLSHQLVIVDQGTQDVVLWTLDNASPIQLSAFPQAINAERPLDVVDVAFTSNGDLYLLTKTGDVYCMGDDNTVISCTLVGTTNFWTCFMESSPKDRLPSGKKEKSRTTIDARKSRMVWHNDGFLLFDGILNRLTRYKTISRTHFKMSETHSFGAGCLVAFNTGSTVFKIPNNERVQLAAIDNKGVHTSSKFSNFKFKEIDFARGFVKDVAIWYKYALVIEGQHLLFIRLHDGSTAAKLPLGFDAFNLVVHPLHNVIAITSECDGSIVFFRVSQHEVTFMAKFNLMTKPLKLVAISLKSSTLAASSADGHVHLLSADECGEFAPIMSKHLYDTFSSMTFFQSSGGQTYFVTLNSDRSEFSAVTVRDTQNLEIVNQAELPVYLYQISESVIPNKIFGTTTDGLKLVLISVHAHELKNEKLDGVETVKTYDNVCWRRMTSDRATVAVYGTDGSVDVFLQGENLTSVLSMNRSLLALNGYEKLLVTHKLKYLVGIHVSGVLTCRSVQHRNKINVSPASPSGFETGSSWRKHDHTALMETSCGAMVEDEVDKSQKLETFVTKHIHRQMISKMVALLSTICKIEKTKLTLDTKWQTNISSTFSKFVRNRNLLDTKYKNLVEINTKSRRKLYEQNKEKRESLKLYSRMYGRFLEEKQLAVEGRAHTWRPNLLKGIGHPLYNFHPTDAAEFEDDAVSGILGFCSDSVTMSAGFEKYTAPRNLRNCGLYARAEAISSHRKTKDGVDDEMDRKKIDLAKKISQAVNEFSCHFLNRHAEDEKEMSENDTIEEEDKSNESTASLIKLTVSSKSVDLATCPVDQPQTDEAPSVKETGPDSSCVINSDHDAHSVVELIPDASDDSTEEHGISSESVSSGSSYDQPGDRSECLPGARSAYLVKMLAMKEIKKKFTFELKDGMLKYYYYLPGEVKQFLRKLRPSSSHAFLNVFPLCLCLDQVNSPLTNRVYFLYTRYFIEALKNYYNAQFKEVKAMERQFWISQTDQLTGEETQRLLEATYDTNFSPERNVEDSSFLVKPLMPLHTRRLSACVDNLFVDDCCQTLEICPAAYQETESLEAIKIWMEQVKIPLCPKCKEQQASIEEGPLTAEPLPTNLEGLPDIKTIGLEKLSLNTRQTLQLVQSACHTKVQALTGSVNGGPTVSICENEQPVTNGMSECSDLLKLLEDDDMNLALGKESKYFLLPDYLKRRKWFIQSQVLTESVQFTTQNYRAQMIVYLMDKCTQTRSTLLEIDEYLTKLRAKSAVITRLFEDLYLTSKDIGNQLNELKQMKKILQHFCKKYNVPGLQEHIDRMNNIHLLTLDDGSSIFYNEEIIACRRFFDEPIWGRPSQFKQTSSALLERNRLMGFISDFDRVQQQIWTAFSAWKIQDVDPTKDEQDTRSSLKSSLRDEIFLIASELYQAELTTNMLLRTIHMRLKKIFEAAGYLKKQNKVHSSYLQKVKVLEKTLDNCVRRWINDERVFMQFPSKDLFKFNQSRSLKTVNSLLPHDNVGWEILLIASKVDKIFMRLTKKSKLPYSKGDTNLSIADLSGKRRKSSTVENMRGKRKEDDIAYHSKRRHSKVTSAKNKKEPENFPPLMVPSKPGEKKSHFDRALDHFVKYMEVNGTADLMEAIRTCDLPSASSNDQQNHNNPGTSVNDEGTRRRFYDNPVFTNVQYLVRQDRQFDHLENDYYSKLLSLIEAKDNFRQRKVVISNMRSRMASLNEEVALIKQYIVSREETHMITNLDKFGEKIKTTTIHNEKESERLIAEVKRSIRLIKKGKFEAVDWLENKLDSAGDDSQLSDEEQLSNKRGSLNERNRKRSSLEPVDSFTTHLVGKQDEHLQNNLISQERSNRENDGQEWAAESGGRNSSDAKDTNKALGEIIRQLMGPVGRTEHYSLCTTHSIRMPPFCCLEHYFSDELKQSDDLQAKRERNEMEPRLETEADLGSDTGALLPCHLILGGQGLVAILRTLQKPLPDCEFPVITNRKRDEDNEGSSKHSSYQLDPTFSSCSSSEQNEFIENGTASSQEKQNSIAERILENRPEIIRNLIRKYIQDKCGELFMSISLQTDDEDTSENNDGIKWTNIIKRELKMHQDDLSYLHSGRCDEEFDNEANPFAERATRNTYEARFRSGMLKEIRDLKDNIQEKKLLVTEMNQVLEKLRLRKYPTFDHYN